MIAQNAACCQDAEAVNFVTIGTGVAAVIAGGVFSCCVIAVV